MKKFYYIVVSVLILCICQTISAEEYVCSYKFAYRTGVFDWFEVKDTLSFTINTEKKTITYPDGFFDKPVYFLDYYVDDTFTIAHIVESLNGGCVPKIIIGAIAFNDVFAYGIFFEEANFAQLEDNPSGKTIPQSWFEDSGALGYISDNSIGEYDESTSTGKIADVSFPCEYFDDTIGYLSSLNCKKSSCSIQKNNEYNKKKQELKNFCNNILEFSNVGLSYCIDKCLNLNEKLNELEGVSNLNLTCGFSERLMNWVINILKWIKYILPVIVIVLGILDFIKAMSLDKDDEMKKAQKRFVIRLIASALVFIIPLILEFVLTKMGLGYNDCGLFK